MTSTEAARLAALLADDSPGTSASEGTIAARLGAELDATRRAADEAAAAVRADVERALARIAESDSLTDAGKLEARAKIEANARDRLAQIKADRDAALDRLGQRARTSALGALESDTLARRDALARARSLTSPAEAADALATAGDDPGLLSAIAVVAASRGWRDVEARVAQARGGGDALEVARQIETERHPAPHDLHRRLFDPFAAPDLLDADERRRADALARADDEPEG